MKKKALPYSNKAGFKTPEGYFENFETEMMSKITSPALLSGEKPFKLPPNYFEQLEVEVFKKIERPVRETRVIALRKNILIYATAAAAAVVLLVKLTVFTESFSPSFSDLDGLAIENYLFEARDLNNPGNLPADSLYFAAANTPKPEIDKEALLEYLNEQIEEPALLFNEE